MGRWACPFNLAGLAWAFYGGIKTWQALKNGKPTLDVRAPLIQLTTAITSLAESSRDIQDLVRRTNELVIGHDNWERARAELQDRQGGR